MTRKDFVLIAAALKDSAPSQDGELGEVCREVWEQTCDGVAHALRSTNPRFDVERFLKAAGVKE